MRRCPTFGFDDALFKDRSDAGRRLAQRLSHLRGRDDLSVLALPRGGVPVAYEIAKDLEAPLDVLVIRKLGAPEQPELAMGAIANGGIVVYNEDVIREYQIPPDAIRFVIDREEAELQRRLEAYRAGRPESPVEGRTVIVVDDGLATGATMRAAVKALRQRKPAAIIIAVPAAPPTTAALFRSVVDEFHAVSTPDSFTSVGGCYENFAQTTDEEVERYLAAAREE